MKKQLLGLLFSLTVLATMSFAYASFQPAKSKAINWMSIEEAAAAQQKEQKKIFIDVYTDWCGWCKVMDRETFSNPEVIQYMNDNFYAVKLNAEQKEAITFQGKTYQYVSSGKRGIHQLAYTLLNGKASYPSYVYLDEQLNAIGLSKGFKKAEPFLQELKSAQQLSQ